MKLIQRIGYYLGGFSMGLIILAFFLNGKKTSCSYGPEARVLKNIRQKNIEYSDIVNKIILENHIDSLLVPYVLKKGSVNFSTSESRKKPCGIYEVEGDYGNKEVLLTIENCDSTATIKHLQFKIKD
ncbi:hypothetical protein [Gaetbulibacter saemankumensis]|uniref:hypothetical protein n=1 Tax=Gaetbulibacter saemankumensis TaxID=311208 RepID=UPI00040F78CA|nr:hypothetical protein [Gaetbulibacter saemankumensis]